MSRRVRQPPIPPTQLAAVTPVYLSHQLAQQHTLRRGRDIDRRPLLHREALLLHDQLTQRTLMCASALRSAASLGACVQPMLAECEGRLQDLGDHTPTHSRDAAVVENVTSIARRVSAARSSALLLRSAAPSDPTPELQRSLTQFCHHRVLSHILAAQFLSGMDGTSAVVAPVSLRDTLNESYAEVRRSFETSLPVPPLSIDEHDDAIVVAPHGIIRYVLQEVLKNATCAMARRWLADPAGAPPLRARIACRGSMACLSLVDAGGGLSPSSADRVWSFGYSDSAPSPLGVEGFGLGLPVSRVYARLFGGDLRLQSVRDGCEVNLWHPTCGVEASP